MSILNIFTTLVIYINQPINKQEKLYEIEKMADIIKNKLSNF